MSIETTKAWGDRIRTVQKYLGQIVENAIPYAHCDEPSTWRDMKDIYELATEANSELEALSASSVSDEQPKAEDRNGLSLKGASAVGNAETPSPSLPETTGSEAKGALRRLRDSVSAFESDVEQAWDREERPDLWEHVVEVAIPDAKAILAAFASPLPTGTDYAGLVERLAQWLHDETDHPDSYPDHTWPEDENDDGRRDGGYVKIVPKHAQEQFRAVAKRILAWLPDQALLTLQQERDDLDRRATEYALQANDQALTIAALQQKNKELEEERDSAVLATHRQAFCIQQCVAHIGPETSATIDGLPKAVQALVATLTASQAERERLKGEVERLEKIVLADEPKAIADYEWERANKLAEENATLRKALEKIARRAKYDEPDVRDDLRRDLRHIEDIARTALSSKAGDGE